MATTAPRTVTIPEKHLVLDAETERGWFLHVDSSSVMLDWFGPIQSPAEIARYEGQLEYARTYGHVPAGTTGKVVMMTEAELWSLWEAAKTARRIARGLA